MIGNIILWIRIIIICVSAVNLSFSNNIFASPSDHLINEKHSGWGYPLDDQSDSRNKKISPTKTISFGFMSYNSSKYPYHYAQDFTVGYKEGDPVYAMAYGKIVRIRKSGGYGGGDPCNSDYNTLVTMHNYFKKDGSIGIVFIFYGHLKNIVNVPEEATKKELSTNIPINKGQKIAELNNPLCAGFKRVHLHLTVIQDNLISEYYDGYNDTQNKNGRVRPFNCSNNENGTWSKDWIDKNENQNNPLNDVVFFDTYKPAPPNEYVKYEAYPFEGCVYREWNLIRSTQVFKVPDSKSEVISVYHEGEKIQAITGETHLKKLGKVVVTKDIIKRSDSKEISFKSGDILYLLEYLGEGIYSIWYKGEVFRLPQGWSDKKAWLSPKTVWGKLLSDLEFNWWVEIAVPSKGKNGWVMNPKAKGMDRFD